MPRRRSTWATATAIAVKSAKLASVLKMVKFTKVLVTASTMFVSTLLYGMVYGPWFAVALISMLFVHEMGHVIAMRQKGLRTSAPVFIPFLGAAIFAPDLGDRETEAYVGYGGPLLGSIGAFLCLAAWLVTGSKLLLLTAFVGLYLNLFNLIIPLRPLDGGRIVQIVGTKTKYVGAALLIGYTLFLREPALLLIWIFALMEINLPLWWKPSIAATLLMAMAALFAADFSRQIWWVNILDIVIGASYTGLFVVVERTRAKRVQCGLPDIELDPRPYPALKTRLSWIGIYLGSVATLWLTMTYVIEQIK
jgi:Zn-dependent protease